MEEWRTVEGVCAKRIKLIPYFLLCRTFCSLMDVVRKALKVKLKVNKDWFECGIEWRTLLACNRTSRLIRLWMPWCRIRLYQTINIKRISTSIQIPLSSKSRLVSGFFVCWKHFAILKDFIISDVSANSNAMVNWRCGQKVNVTPIVYPNLTCNTFPFTSLHYSK